jgi:hypothetical protein
MALVTCNLCGQKISSRAKSCPKCGCPVLSRGNEPFSVNTACKVCGLADPSTEVYCNLCTLPHRNSRPASSAPISPGSYLIDRQQSDLITQKIDALSVDHHLKELFKLMARGSQERVIMGIPVYAGDNPQLRPWDLKDWRHSLASLGGLCCGPLYYFHLKLWKKGTVLTVMLLVIAGICSILLPEYTSATALLPGILIVNLLAGMMMKYDMFRQLVQGEDFWW